MQKLVIVLAALCALMLPDLKAQENVIDEVVWIVGDDAILRSEVEERYRDMQYEGQRINGDPYCVIPEEIAVQKLFLHQAKLDTVEMSESQVIQTVEARLNSFIANIGSKEKLEEYFNKPMSKIREEMSETVREMGTVQQMQQMLVKDVAVTPAEVRRYFAKLPEDSLPFIPTQVEVQIITLNPRVPQEEIDDIKTRLREFTDRIHSGETEFSTLAIMYSQDPVSARMGGELGFLGKGSLVPEYANVAFNLNDHSKVSKIVESEFGFHIIQLIEKRGDRINTRHILLKPQISQTEINDAMTHLDSLQIRMNEEDIAFEKMVPYVSHDKDTRNNGGIMVNQYTGTTRFEMGQLPQEIAKTIATMEVNDISAPFVYINERQAKEVVAIVKLKSRVEGHKANLSNDYQVLKQIVEEEKRSKVLHDWILKKQSETYISIREGWNKCDFKYDGWVKD